MDKKPTGRKPSRGQGEMGNRTADGVRTTALAEHDPVNKPQHYRSDPSGIECIEITQHRNFCVGNAIKYLWRAGLKEAGSSEKQVEDLQKAIWYINQEIKRLGLDSDS